MSYKHCEFETESIHSLKSRKTPCVSFPEWWFLLLQLMMSGTPKAGQHSVPLKSLSRSRETKYDIIN